MWLYLAIHSTNYMFGCFAAVGFVLMAVTFVITYISIRKRTNAEHEAKETKKKLEQSYIELGEAYQQVKLTQLELSSRFKELQRSEERNKKLAFTDFVTNLPNRIAFSEKLEIVLDSRDKKEIIAIMYLDIDNFKNVNDNLGHSYGDELLIDVAGTIGKVLDENDYIARFGGDEFIILSRFVQDRKSYEEKIKQIYKKFRKPFLLLMKEFFVTISSGIIYGPDWGESIQNILKNVDTAMYAAKELGKNTYCFYDESLNRKRKRKMDLKNDLKMAIKNKEFVVYYQAQIDLHQEKIAGFEALVRWNHPLRGMIQPAEFIQAAEETGQIVEIGSLVLFEACSQLRKWNQAGFQNLNIAVNLSARQFKDPGMIKMVKMAVLESGIQASHLELEITESIVLEDIDYSVEAIQTLKKMGIQFSLDDFGTGYSSMNYLKYLPVSSLKIDKSFLSNILGNSVDQKIVSAIISLSQTLELDVTAEGVEKKEQVQFLKHLNCNKAQGFLYSEPVPAEQVNVILDKLKRQEQNQNMDLIKIFSLQEDSNEDLR